MKFRKNLFCRFSSLLLAMSMVVLMAGAMGGTALAADNEVIDSTVKVNRASAVPVSQTENDINGRHILTKVFEVNPSTDPETLKEDGMTVGGYTYELVSFTKETDSFEDVQTVSEPQTLPLTAKTSADAYKEAVVSFSPTIEYDKDGYSGTLYLDNASIEVSETGRTEQKGSDGVTKSYTCEYNDDGEIPATITYNGKTYNRSSISWADGEYGEGDVVPNNYVATVRYTRSYTYSTVDGYQATATYAGEVSYKNTSIIRYTAEYVGTPVSNNLGAMANMGQVTGFYQDAQGNYQPVMGMGNSGAGMDKTILTAIIVLVGVVFILAIGVAILVTLMISNNKKNQQLMQMRSNNQPVMLLGPAPAPASNPQAPAQQQPVQAEPTQTQE